MEFWIADFYGWLWILGTLFGMWYMYRTSKPYRKKIKKTIKKVKPFDNRSTPIANLH